MKYMNQYNKEHLYKRDILLYHIIGTLGYILLIAEDDTCSLLRMKILPLIAEEEDTAAHC